MESFDFKDPLLRERIIAENRLAFAFLNKMPILPGHTLICPKEPLVLSQELTSDIWLDILNLKEIVCTKLRQVVHAKGFNFAWNEGSVAGQTVAHFHLHIVPRNEGDAGIVEYEPRVFLYRTGSRADSPKEELIVFAKQLKGDLGESSA